MLKVAGWSPAQTIIWKPQFTQEWMGTLWEKVKDSERRGLGLYPFKCCSQWPSRLSLALFLWPQSCGISYPVSLSFMCKLSTGGGWVRQRCHVSYVTRASSWVWLTVEQGLLSLQQYRVEEEFISALFSLSFIFLFLSCPSLSYPLLSFLYFFSLSLGDDTKWPTRVDVSLNSNTISQLRLAHDCEQYQLFIIFWFSFTVFPQKINFEKKKYASLFLFIPWHMIVAGYYGFTLVICVSVCLSQPTCGHILGRAYIGYPYNPVESKWWWALGC